MGKTMTEKDLIQEPRDASLSASAPANEYGDAEEREAEYKNHAATVPSEPTDAQVEAAAKAYGEHHGIWGDEFREQVCPECGYLYFTEEQRRMGTDSRAMYRKVESHRMREALIVAGVARAVIDRDALVDAIAGGTISVPGGYGNLQRDDAENIVDAIISHLTANTGGQE